MAIELDLRTAVLVCTALTFLSGLMLLVAQLFYVDPFRRSLRWWLAALLLYALSAGGLFGASGGGWPLVLAITLLTSALACANLAVHALLGSRERPWVLAVLVGFSVLVAAWFTFVQPSALARIVLVSLLVAALLLRSLQAIYREQTFISRSAHLLAACFALGIVCLGIRAFHVGLVAGGDEASWRLADAPALGLLLACALPSLATIAFLLLAGERSQTDLQLTARTDSLTAAMNRRAIEDAGRQAFSSARRHGGCVSLVVIDVDHFKRVNDELGHAAGDALLVLCVERIRASMRQEDVLGRLGGGEFVVLMTDTDLEHAARAAERIRHEFGVRTFPLASGERVVSVSLGVACLVAADAHFGELLRRADRAMYAAKEAGRDRTMIERDSRLCVFP